MEEDNATPALPVSALHCHWNDVMSPHVYSLGICHRRRRKNKKCEGGGPRACERRVSLDWHGLGVKGDAPFTPGRVNVAENTIVDQFSPRGVELQRQMRGSVTNEVIRHWNY